jgi:hypothetical protein
MKKVVIFVVVFAFLVPAAALAATEFSLGGFVKLNSYWDSTQNGHHMSGSVLRDNNPSFHHGHMKFTSQESRFNFTIKGPKVFGAQTTGFIEIDFDATERARLGVDTASNSFTPRVRHAMFRLNWPETELLFGQYWSLFCSWYAEAAEAGPFQRTGTPTARLAQIRLTQKFLGDWSVTGLVGEPNNVGGFAAEPYSGNATNGESCESPQVQASIKYAHDWWGKAAYYGHPIPFTAQVSAGWQRNVLRSGAYALDPMSQNDPIALAAVAGRTGNQYQAPWLVMGSLFIPVMPTHSANLAGTASILAQYWIGQGVTAFGFTGDSSQVWKFANNNFALNNYDVELLQRWGGFVEGQYYFTNQWFVNIAYAMSKVFGLDQGQDPQAPLIGGNRYVTAFSADQQKLEQQVDATLWYRPVQALKFGLQYSYGHTAWLQKLSTGAVGQNVENNGNEQRVEFVGYFFF